MNTNTDTITVHYEYLTKAWNGMHYTGRNESFCGAVEKQQTYVLPHVTCVACIADVMRSTGRDVAAEVSPEMFAAASEHAQAFA